MTDFFSRAAHLIAVTGVISVLICSAALSGPETRSIPHDLGVTDISGKPVKVVALEYSFVQALDSLGAMPAGIADDDQYARIEQLLGKTTTYTSVGTRLEPNLEIISHIEPDLIIADRTRHAQIYTSLSSIAPTIVLNSWEGSYQEIEDSVVTIADALGDRAKGEDFVVSHKAIMAELASKIPSGENRRILLVVANPDSVAMHTSTSFSGSVFQMLHLPPAIINHGADPVESNAGLERLVAVNPDILLVATDRKGTVFEQWQGNAAWENISAVKNKLVFEVDRNQFSRFRGLQTAERIAREVLQKVYNVN